MRKLYWENRLGKPILSTTLFLMFDVVPVWGEADLGLALVLSGLLKHWFSSRAAISVSLQALVVLGSGLWPEWVVKLSGLASIV